MLVPPGDQTAPGSARIKYGRWEPAGTNGE